MIMDIKKCEHINTIQKMLNIDKSLAEKIYEEAGTDIDKIYLSLKNQKKEVYHDKLYSKCLRCGRTLKTLESKICGYGSICKDKVSKSKKLIKKNSIIGDLYDTHGTTKGVGEQ